MTHFQIILLHHDPSLVYSVLDQFEDDIISQQQKHAHKDFHVVESKRKLASFITNVSILLSNDISRIIVDYIHPPLVIMNENYYENGKNSDNYLLSFYDHYVEFDKMSFVHFASQNFMKQKHKTCFIQLFDEKEAKLLLSMEEMATVYGFLTRLFGALFESSHHIHLFAKHKRESIQQYKEDHKKAAEHLWVKFDHNQLKEHQLASFSSLKILSHLLSTIIHKNKLPPMAMYLFMT